MKVIDQNGTVFDSIRKAAQHYGLDHTSVSKSLKEGHVYQDWNRTCQLSYHCPEPPAPSLDPETVQEFNREEISAFLESRSASEVPFVRQTYRLQRAEEGVKYAVALFSDAHIEETVVASTVLGYNEYNLDIARRRVQSYFNHLALCLNEDRAEALVFASLGDTISGYIHDELAQTNGLSPLEAIYEAQNLIYNGLRFLLENTHVKDIRFIGICGNHSRTTKRIQFANGYRMSYEWLMYKNIEKESALTGLPVTFDIPESELMLLDAPDGKRFVFMHGYQIRSSGTNTVCGIYPALNRLTMKFDKNFHQDRVYLGHFHTCVSIPNAVINGSIIGFTAFSMNNGFTREEPAQMYQLFDTRLGELLTRKIYCD